MPELPNAEAASIPAAKLRDYLLNPHHPQNHGKARLFEALGYSLSNWELLADDLRTQHLTKAAVETRNSPFGRRFKIIAVLEGPEGSASIMSVWQVDHGTQVPRFLTAYPS